MAAPATNPPTNDGPQNNNNNNKNVAPIPPVNDGPQNDNNNNNVTISDQTQIATSIQPTYKKQSANNNNNQNQPQSDPKQASQPKPKPKPTKSKPKPKSKSSAASSDNKSDNKYDDDEQKVKGNNTRGIPKAIYLKNPYEIIYKNQQEKYLKEVETILGKYKLMENQLVKQKLNKIDQRKEMKKNIEVCNYLKLKSADGDLKTQFEVSDQLYSSGTIKQFDNVAIWLGANVMMEFPVDEAIEFLKKRVIICTDKINTLQNDIDFCRDQINIVEVNRSRVYNANVKVKKAREAAQAQKQKQNKKSSKPSYSHK